METPHDIYSQQDKSTIESVLQSFDYDVSEAVQWFTDVPAPNLDTRVNDTALNTEFIGILDVDTLLNEEGMNAPPPPTFLRDAFLGSFFT